MVRPIRSIQSYAYAGMLLRSVLLDLELASPSRLLMLDKGWINLLHAGKRRHSITKKNLW